MSILDFYSVNTPSAVLSRVFGCVTEVIADGSKTVILCVQDKTGVHEDFRVIFDQIKEVKQGDFICVEPSEVFDDQDDGEGCFFARSVEKAGEVISLYNLE